MDRRSFLFGAAASLLAAPAIVKFQSIMPVKLVRWASRPRGLVTYESYPWVVTIDYSKLGPHHKIHWDEDIASGHVDVQCLHEQLKREEHEQWVADRDTRWPAPVDLDTLQRVNRESFAYGSMEDVANGLVLPKVT